MLDADDFVKRVRVAAQQERDFTDLQNEIMGNETGRQSRFLSTRDTEERRVKRERQERAFRSALALMLEDPEYARLYAQVGDALQNAEIEADKMLAKIQSELDAVEQEIAEMEAGAARDPNGELVFQYADGRVVYADGSAVPPEIAEGIVWPPNAPSAEAYFGLKDRQEALETLLDQWHVYRSDVLGGIRDRYEDEENPFASTDNLDAALDHIKNTRPPPFSNSQGTPLTTGATGLAQKQFPSIPERGQ